MNEPNLNKKIPIKNSMCTIHKLEYEFFCSDCECLACPKCSAEGPHQRETHRLVHLEQMVGLVYANQAHFMGRQYERVRGVFEVLNKEVIGMMHRVRGEADDVKGNTIRYAFSIF